MENAQLARLVAIWKGNVQQYALLDIIKEGPVGVYVKLVFIPVSCVLLQAFVFHVHKVTYTPPTIAVSQLAHLPTSQIRLPSFVNYVLILILPLAYNALLLNVLNVLHQLSFLIKLALAFAHQVIMLQVSNAKNAWFLVIHALASGNVVHVLIRISGMMEDVLYNAHLEKLKVQ